MKKTILLTFTFFMAMVGYGQTWTGASSTDWNTAGNWSPSGIPGAGANITIPGNGITNWPKFASAVTINNLDMPSGSRLDLNGFLLTINGNFNANGATFNNTNAAADIAITTSGVGQALVSNSTFNDAVLLTYGSTTDIYESYVGANTYLSNLTVIATSTANIRLAFGGAINVGGNLTVTRNVAGYTSIFGNGGNITGNFSYTNNFGGDSYIGAGSAVANVGGTVNMSSNFSASNPAFVVSKLKNQTTGGTINVQNAGYVNFTSDTLKLTAFSTTGFRNGTVNDFNSNDITATITIGDNASTANTIYFRGNDFKGNTTFNLNGSGDMYESYGGRNLFAGNVTYNIAGTTGLHHGYGYYANSAISGSLTINRTGTGNTDLLNGGGSVGGNFSYTNNAGGSTNIGSSSYPFYITGNITLTSDFGTNTHNYVMRHVLNQGTGGSINIQHPNYVIMTMDTLKATSISITGIKSGTTSDFDQNDFIANFTLGDDATTGSYTYLRRSKITGNTVINRSGSQSMYEAYTGPNLFIGNTTYNLNGSGDLYLSYDSYSVYQGNLSITRTVAGNSNLFNNRGANISGNFIFNSNVGGSINIGSLSAGSDLVDIGGTLNILINPVTESPVVNFGHVTNRTAGGSIAINNAGYVKMSIDTLKLTSITLTNIKNSSTSDILNCNLESSFSMSDDATVGTYTYFRGNVVTGDVTFNRNGPLDFYDAYQRPNYYLGNVTYNRSGTSPIFIAYDNATTYTKNLTFNVSGQLSIGTRFSFAGATNSTLLQSGSAPLNLGKLRMEKTGSGKLILSSPINISDSLIFAGGNIESSATNRVNFANNASHGGASASSHIVGVVSKTGDDAFTFPVGTATSIDSVSMSAPASTTDRFSAQYFYADATLSGYDTAQRAATLKRVSGCEYWDVKREAGTSNVSLTLGYDGACTTSGMYVTLPSALRVAHWTGSTWEDLGNGGSTGATVGTVKTAAPVTNFSPFSIASVDLLINPLPLKLISFKGFRQGVNIRLLWQTENEVSLSRYELEKSADGIHFEFMERVNASNRSGINNYSGIDVTPTKGFNYYRLKQFDIDGSFTYSNVAKVNFDGKLSLSISPNPVKDKLVISEAVPGDVIRIFDVQGKSLRSYQVKYVNEPISIAVLPAGVYALQLSNNNSLQTIQFIKQ